MTPKTLPDSAAFPDLGPGQEARSAAETPPEPAIKPTWPKSMPDQVEAVRRLLAIGPQTPEALATHFKRKPTKSITQVLAALQIPGQATTDNDHWRLT